MRWPVIVIALLFVGLPASAQVAQDATGDASGRDLAEPLPSPVQGAWDLVSLAVDETRSDFTFHVEVADLSGSETADQTSSYFVEFRHEDQRFGIQIYRQAIAGAPYYSAHLQVYDEGRDAYSNVATMDLEINGDVMSVAVPREHLRDGNGVPPSPGRVLQDFVVHSTGIRMGTICIMECLAEASWGDRMPDEGVSDQVHEVLYGVKQTGHARLFSEQPFRASNGEATTFVFHVMAHNLGDEDERFAFNISGAPPQWDVRTPASTVKIEAGGSVEVPVVVRTAFAHAHGSATTFLLEMESLADPSSVGRIEMGVYYPDPPQPAGHHDTLWIHTRDLSSDPMYFALATALQATLIQSGLMQAEYLNTLEDDELADEVPSEGSNCGSMLGDADYPAGHRYCWTIPLEPGLEMGLDFDLDRTGSLDVAIGSQVPMPATAVSGELVHLAPVDNPEDPFAFFNREGTVLATMERSAPQDIGPLSQASYTLEVVPTPEADLIPYQQGAALELRLEVVTARPDNLFIGPSIPPPTLQSGARLQLPLLEYEDPVQGTVGFGDDVLLDAITEQERKVNPGKTVLFKVKLQNAGTEEHTFRLDLVGSHRDWSRLLGVDTVKLGPGKEHEIAVAVSVPGDAEAGDRADLVLEAASQQDLGSRALIRLVAVVATDEDIPDESEAAGLLDHAPAKKSPAALWLGLVLALFVARRRSNR